MEEHAKEVEHDLRENIDMIQNQLREVCGFVLIFDFDLQNGEYFRKRDKSNNFNIQLEIMNEQY